MTPDREDIAAVVLGREPARFYCSYCDADSLRLICPKCENRAHPNKDYS